VTEHLTGEAYHVLQASLLRRLGELTQLRIRLPELPIAQVAVHAGDGSAPAAQALTVDVMTSLPVRAGLVPRAAQTAPPSTDDIEVRVSASTAVELANWGIAHGRLPQHYSRSLKPEPNGAFSPRLDYIAGDQRPFKVHVFEAGGCSYYEVGLMVALSIVGDQLVVQSQHAIEAHETLPLLEFAMWVHELIKGGLTETHRAAANIAITAGGRTWTVRATSVDLVGDELRSTFTLAGAPAEPAPPAPPGSRAATSLRAGAVACARPR
jgi:hypothetical protein